VVIELPKELRSATVDQATVIHAVARIIETKSAQQWMQDFAGRDVCCSIVASLKEAAEDPHFADRNVLARMMTVDGKSIPALPLPVLEIFADGTAGSPPRLGANTSALLNIQG